MYFDDLNSYNSYLNLLSLNLSGTINVIVKIYLKYSFPLLTYLDYLLLKFDLE